MGIIVTAPHWRRGLLVVKAKKRAVGHSWGPLASISSSCVRSSPQSPLMHQ